MAFEISGNDKNVEILKMKKLIKLLDSVRGHGTSLISLTINPQDQTSRVAKMLAEEHQTASNIKKRVTRQSVLDAITSAQSRLKLYKTVPRNGIVLYTGMGITEDDDKFGFIVIDGNGTLIGTLSGDSREVVHKFKVELPKKHGRGGQSALRFSHLQIESRHNYLRKTAEQAAKCFIDPETNKPNVVGLILAGSAEFKTELSQSDMFDPRLRGKVLKVLDISFSGKEEINQDTGKYVFGIDDTIKALEMGVIEILLVGKDLGINRFVLKNIVSNELTIKHLNKEQEADHSNFQDSDTASEFEVASSTAARAGALAGDPGCFPLDDEEDKMALVEWLSYHYTEFGCSMEFVTNKSEEGSQFCSVFDGIGGILRYEVDIRAFDEDSDDDDDGVAAE
ncbi:hypothetical protein QYF36_012425 [Acer negundo]|nr:hypothetical protein QYF36_012425 [Acer negundo]